MRQGKDKQLIDREKEKKMKEQEEYYRDWLKRLYPQLVKEER